VRYVSPAPVEHAAAASAQSRFDRCRRRACAPGIFAYLNYKQPRPQSVIVDTLLNGLCRLEYRGYDSAGTRAAAPRRGIP